MEKSKIAESIIIRVGGGIREVFREPLENQDATLEPAPNEPVAEKTEGAKIYHPEGNSPTSI